MAPHGQGPAPPPLHELLLSGGGGMLLGGGAPGTGLLSAQQQLHRLVLQNQQLPPHMPMEHCKLTAMVQQAARRRRQRQPAAALPVVDLTAEPSGSPAPSWLPSGQPLPPIEAAQRRQGQPQAPHQTPDAHPHGRIARQQLAPRTAVRSKNPPPASDSDQTEDYSYEVGDSEVGLRMLRLAHLYVL